MAKTQITKLECRCIRASPRCRTTTQMDHWLHQRNRVAWAVRLSQTPTWYLPKVNSKTNSWTQPISPWSKTVSPSSLIKWRVHTQTPKFLTAYSTKTIKIARALTKSAQLRVKMGLETPPYPFLRPKMLLRTLCHRQRPQQQPSMPHRSKRLSSNKARSLPTISCRTWVSRRIWWFKNRIRAHPSMLLQQTSSRLI